MLISLLQVQLTRCEYWCPLISPQDCIQNKL